MTPTKRRWLNIAAAVVVTVALSLAGLYIFWPNPSVPQTGAAIGQIMQNGSTMPSAGVQPYVAASPVDYQKQDAVRVHKEYPEYYLCRAYPSDASLKQADLVPTANVVVTITYNSYNKKYVVDGDPRIVTHETDSVQPANSDVNHPYRLQEFRFSFADGVHYFATYQRYQAGNGVMRWSQVTVYGTRMLDDGRMVQDYDLPLSPENGKAEPAYVIVASDIRTCHAGQASVPAGFRWDQIADDGLLLPEFYGSGEHPQG